MAAAIAQPSEDLRCTCYRVRKAARALTQLYDRLLEPSGLTVTQMSLLTELARFPSLSITGLGRHLGMDRTTTSRTVKPMLACGLIREIAGEDRRARNLALTDKGSAALQSAVTAWRRAETAMLQALGEGRREQLYGLLGDASQAALSAERKLAG